jgi:hypothetical protein
MAFRLRRGTAAELNNITPAEGELIYTTDTKKLFVGDGVTQGGITTAAGYTGSAGGSGHSLVNNSYTLDLNALGTLTVPGSIVPDTNVSYDLGGPNNRFRDLYLSGNTMYLGQYSMSIDVTGRLQINDSQGHPVAASKNSLTNNGYEAGLSDTGVFTVPGPIVPDNNVTHDLGTAEHRFKDLYLGGNSIYLGDYSISFDSNGQLEIFNGNVYTTVGSSLTVGGLYSVTLDNAGNLTVPGNITPDSGASWDLGDSNYPFRDIYLSDMIRLGDYHTLTIDDTGLQVDGINFKESINLGYLINEGNLLSVNSDGTISFPNDTLALTPLTNFLVNTASDTEITATVTQPGTGYGVGPGIGISSTTGGSGTGLTVSFAVTISNGVGSVTIVNPGTGYRNGDILTIDEGNGDAEIQLSISAELYAWTFDSSGNTTFPGKVSFESSAINENYNAEALVFGKSGTYKGIATSGGTADVGGVEALIIAGGDAYEDPVTNMRTGGGGDITLIAGQGSTGGTVNIVGGQGPTPGDVNINAGGAVVPVSVSGGALPPASGSGGIVSIIGGIGNTGVAGGGVVIVGGSGNGGDGGSVAITGGVGSDNGVDKRGGDVTIQGGIAEDAGGVGGKISLKTDSTLQGGRSRQWDFDVNGVLTVPGSIIPDTNIAYNLGSATKRFKDLYLSSNTINLGGTTISVNSSGQLQVGGSDVAIYSLINGSNSLTLNSTGTLTFPGNSISQATNNDLSIKTNDGLNSTTATVTVAGSGYDVESGTSATSGGSGTGLTVFYTGGGAGSVSTVQITDAGTGYQTGDVLTLIAGNGDAKITLTVTPIIYNWKFDRFGTTSFPGKFNFYNQVINDYGDRAEALVFNKSAVDKTIATSAGTVATPGVESLSIRGGNSYKYGYQNWERNGQGGDVRMFAGEGNPGGSVTIRAGRGLVPGTVSIEGANSETPGTGNTGTGGGVNITGGFGSVVNDLGTGNGGSVTIRGGGTYSNAGKSGSVYIIGGPAGVGLPTGPGRTASAGDVVIRGGQSLDIGGKGGIVTIATNAFIQGGAQNLWTFNLDGKTTFPVNAAPANNYGVAGDKAGMVAFDNNYVYYCTGNYVDNSTPIWKRIALSTW